MLLKIQACSIGGLEGKGPPHLFLFSQILMQKIQLTRSCPPSPPANTLMVPCEKIQNKEIINSEIEVKRIGGQVVIACKIF